MKNHPPADEPPPETLIVRPDWPWWLVMWKAFVSLFVLGFWWMTLLWSLLIGTWFGLNSTAMVWKFILASSLNILPAWALWAVSVSVWTERQSLTLKSGLLIGVLFSAGLVVYAAQKATSHEDVPASAMRGEMALPFCLLTFVCFFWELWRQFKPSKPAKAGGIEN